jgi:hypothetical protein
VDKRVDQYVAKYADDLKGDKGDKGDKGVAGEPGPKGDTGDVGPAGAAGSPGATGATGAQGPKGDAGPQGVQGEQGPAGFPGLPGQQGAQGIQGIPGTPSPDTLSPTIDGYVATSEWDGATVIPVSDSMGTVSVLAYSNNLYVLLELPDTTDARMGQNIKGNDQASLNVNPTDGGAWGFPYDLIFETSADFPWNPKINSGDVNGWHTRWLQNDVQYYVPGGLKSATTYTGTTRITEWCLPVNWLGLSPGDPLRVGGAIEIGNGNSYAYPVGLVWGDVSTFTEILVQPQP